jgi:hypothetical protein
MHPLHNHIINVLKGIENKTNGGMQANTQFEKTSAY